MKTILKALIVLLPWRLKRWVLQRRFGYRLHPTARIGLAWIYPSQLVMGPRARIAHFSVAIHLDRIEMDEGASIGRSNWITGFSTLRPTKHFQHQTDRRAELRMGAASAITKNHHIDCTNLIEIGAFTTVAGYNSQLLTHSIDLFESRQNSVPISIGAYCFVGTNVVILGGGHLPSYSVLGAKSLLNKRFEEEGCLYAGVPAARVKPISREAKYFKRTEGFVN
ncbi:MAG: acyltransferase [Catalinimonas sp.]